MTLGYIGSYTKKSGKGIYRFNVNEEQGKIDLMETGYEVEASTYLTHNENYLYAITKNNEDCGVASFKIEEDGKLTFNNQCLASTTGTGCYVQLSEDNEYLFEAVYGAGIIRLYKVNPQNGEVEKLIEELKHDFPVGPNKDRQDQPHAHYLHQSPEGKYVIASDLGADRLVSYTFGEDGFKEYAQSKFQDGDGVRHVEFHDNGKYAYVVHELSNYVSVTTYRDGKFEELERHLTIPEDFEGATKLAAVRLSHDQKFLYVSNRGHNSIAIYKVLEDGAKLELVDIASTEGDFPRDFNITPSDNYLVCAHQEADYPVSVFKRDTQTGKLTLTDQHTKADEGVCVIF